MNPKVRLLLKRAPHWSEEQAERALRAAEIDTAEFDRWLATHPLDGKLEAMLDASTDDMLDETSAEERQNGFGAWKP